MYSEETLNIPILRITYPPNLSESSIRSFIRNAYVAVGVAGASALLLGLTILLIPRFAAAGWPFNGAQAAEGDEVLLHDPKLSLLEAAVNPDPNPSKGASPLTLSEGSALIAAGGIEEETKEEAPEEPKVEKPKPAPKKAEAKKPAAPKTKSLPAISGYFGNPLPGGRISQGVHGHNGVDVSAPAGTPIYAAAAGTVTAAAGSGYNGGYGSYVELKHGNGTKTLYAHMSRIAVSSGSVAKGELIGYVGNTGKSTGNHLHFEVHGASNPLAR